MHSRERASSSNWLSTSPRTCMQGGSGGDLLLERVLAAGLRAFACPPAWFSYAATWQAR